MLNVIKTNLKSIIIISVLSLGLLVTLYLVKRPQIFNSRANQDLQSNFELIQNKGNGELTPAECMGDTCTVESLELYFKVKDFDQLPPE